MQSKIASSFSEDFKIDEITTHNTRTTHLEFDRLAVHNEVGELPGDGVLLAPFLRLGARLDLVSLQEHVQGTEEGMNRTPKNAKTKMRDPKE